MIPSRRGSSPPSLVLFDPEWHRLAFALYLALLAQTTILARLSPHGGTLSLVLLLVLWFATHAGPARGALFGLIAGVCEDAVAGTGIAWGVADAVTAAFAGSIGRVLPGMTPLLAAPLAGVLTLARYVIFSFAWHVQGESSRLISLHWHPVLWQAGLNVVAALIASIIDARFDLTYGTKN